MAGNIIYLDDNNFNKEVKESKIPVIIDFWAEWCGPCRMMGPVFEELSNDYTGKLKFTKLDTDKYGDLAGDFEIQGIPSLLILNKGKEVDRIVGFAPKPALKAKIDAILAKIK